jgi:hypothetical protein
MIMKCKAGCEHLSADVLIIAKTMTVRAITHPFKLVNIMIKYSYFYLTNMPLY